MTAQNYDLKGKPALYEVFFDQLIVAVRGTPEFGMTGATGKGNYRTFTCETRGFTYAAVFPRGGRVRAEIYIDFGDRARNLAAFTALHAKREEMEGRFGRALEWEELPGKQACRVALYRDGRIEDRQSLDEYRRWLLQNLVQFKKVFGK